MEMLTNKEVKPLVVKLTNGKEKENEQFIYKIKMAILGVVNEYIGINAQEVLKLLLNGLKMPKIEGTDLVKYVRNATLWVITNKRKEILKPIGEFVNVIEFYNDFREKGFEDKNPINKKYFELLCYHVAYENPFVTVSKLREVHKTCLLKTNTFEDYLTMFEFCLAKMNIAIPKEALQEKAKRKMDEWDKMLSEMKDEEQI